MTYLSYSLFLFLHRIINSIGEEILFLSFSLFSSLFFLSISLRLSIFSNFFLYLYLFSHSFFIFISHPLSMLFLSLFSSSLCLYIYNIQLTSNQINVKRKTFRASLGNMMLFYFIFDNQTLYYYQANTNYYPFIQSIP